ncbi:MAG: hypothetical protein U1D25_02035 [Hydrogenophaga sp.]|jgi:hypothetical protein|uniref:hypothetical protein n=1 Tax=Hydrogenophaga sp. TaxID=1904254 RepID=UPI00276B1606|nr:hypothetical protein [Hydrogenophaga sp.]MDP2418734.1 hypothetical protein [Hydrogenophaga sp.]MDZ4186875.1 hypothetical protein [Hydrogenophaga sp.]
MRSTGIKARLSHAQWSLKPQDLAMALKLVCLAGEKVIYTDLARAMHMSQFEAHACMARLGAARLLTDVGGAPALVMPAFRPLLLQGAPYFFPAVRGELTMGFPTAYGVEPLKSKVLFADELPPVWPHEDGTTRGAMLLPLYPKLPLAAVQDPALYELLALFDALRIGQARERDLARTLLEERLKKVAV